MTTPVGMPAPVDDVHPELVLLGVEAMRWRMREMLGDGWPAFEKRLNSRLIKLKRAKGEERERLTRELIEWGLDSRAAELFDTIRFHAGSPAAMKDLRLQQKRLEAEARAREEVERRIREAERAIERDKQIAPYDMPMSRPPSRPSMAGSERVTSPSASAPADAAEPGETRSRNGSPKKDNEQPPVEPRYVNVNFLDKSGGRLSQNKALVKDHEYRLSVDIGSYSPESIVVNPSVVRSDLLPPMEGGHWLQIAVASWDFKVSQKAHWLFLPTSGSAWSCRCEPGGPHTCGEADRRSHVLIEVRAPTQTGGAELRLTVYYERSVVQSMLVRATVRESADVRGVNSATVDFNLTNHLTDLGQTQPKALSVVMNHSNNGTHKLIFNGAPDAPIGVELTDDQMTSALKLMREVMRRIHIEDVSDTQKDNRFDARNAKSLEAFIKDLRELAFHGWHLWGTLLTGKESIWKQNRDRLLGPSDVIQIARKAHSNAVFPWAMVYFIPLEPGAPENNQLCKLLEPNEWRKFQGTAGNVPSRCPFEDTHATGVICPYGFWGFRYQIEQPPSLQVGRSRPTKIPADQDSLDFIVGLSEELDRPLRDGHLKALRTQHKKFKLHECYTRDQIKAGLALRDLEVVYFYCHGYSNPLPGAAGTMPSLGVGRQQAIVPPDLTTWGMGWPDDHWKTTAPLVFINGCHTADTTPQTLVNFVDSFSASLDAAGVIGTEITIHQLIANEMGQTFLDSFQRGRSVGEALRHARGELLRKGNLLGLVYTAYCSADLSLAADCS